MRYLVTMDYVDPGPLLPLEGLVEMVRGAIIPGFEALVRLESEGKILAGGTPVGGRALAFIAEADSNNELHTMLEDLPLWGVVKTQVTPLQTMEDRLEYERRAVERTETTPQQ